MQTRFASDDTHERPLTIGVVVAICSWWVLYSLLYAVSNYLLAINRGQDMDWSQALRFGINVGLPFILPCCLLWWVVMRFPVEPGKLASRVALYLSAMLVASLLRILMRDVVFTLLPYKDRPRMGPLMHELGIQISLNLMWFIALVFIAYGWSYFKRTQAQRLRISQMETRLAQTRLDALRAQLNPHFLFNSLNSVAEVVHQDAGTADRMLVAISRLLRDRLAVDDAQQRPLGEELSLVREYLAIEQMRLGPRLRQEWDVADDTLDVLVPALSVQVLVENAIVHAISKQRRAGRLVVRACIDGPDLHVVVENSLPHGDIVPSPGAGIGLASVKERLRLIHGAAASMSREVECEQNGHRVELVIPKHSLHAVSA